MKQEPETYVLSFVAAAGHAAPIEVRVRRLLKAALRSYGLRCTRVSSRQPWADDQKRPPAAAA